MLYSRFLLVIYFIYRSVFIYSSVIYLNVRKRHIATESRSGLPWAECGNSMDHMTTNGHKDAFGVGAGMESF